MLGNPFFSLQETIEHCDPQIKAIKEMLDHKYYDYDEANLLRGQGAEDQTKIMETLRRISLIDLVKRAGDDLPYLRRGRIREFLARSGTTGLAGAAYLIPDKIHQIMWDPAVEADICPLISAVMIPAEQIPGATLKIDVAVDESFRPKKFSSGGAAPVETIKTVQSTLDFKDIYSLNFPIANDLIEDAQFDVIEMHLRDAGREMGEYASNEALTILSTAPDGDGNLNSGASGDADATKFQGATTTDIVDAIQANIADGMVPDTMVCTHEAMLNSIMITIGAQYQESVVWDEFAHGGWPTKMAGMDVIYSDVDVLTNSKAMTNCLTLIFTKAKALVTGRKRWLRIENYSDPISDLSGAIVTCRQDSVTLYKDSIFTLTET